MGAWLTGSEGLEQTRVASFVILEDFLYSARVVVWNGGAFHYTPAGSLAPSLAGSACRERRT